MATSLLAVQLRALIRRGLAVTGSPDEGDDVWLIVSSCKSNFATTLRAFMCVTGYGSCEWRYNCIGPGKALFAYVCSREFVVDFTGSSPQLVYFSYIMHRRPQF